MSQRDSAASLSRGCSKGRCRRTKSIEDDPLHQAALAVEKDKRLAAEMAEWEEATIGDGINDGENRRKPTR